MELRMMEVEVEVTTGAIGGSKSQIVTTNKPTPSILQARCPSCCPTNSVKALKSITITFHGPAHLKFTCGLRRTSDHVFDHKGS